MNTARKLAFAAATTTLVFGLAELVLAGLGAASGRDWRVDPLPAHEQYEVLCDYGDLVRLCPDRGPSYERVRPLVFSRTPELPRVVTIGESFVYGLGLPTEQAWPARLQAHLAAAGVQAEVLNLGRCGTYASRLVPLVEAAVALDADVVVIAAGNNEHTMTSFYTGWAGRHPLAVYRASEAMGRLRLYGLLVGLIGLPTRVEESFEAHPEQFGAAVDQQVYAARRRPPDLSAFHRDDLPEGVALAGAEVTRILEEEQRLKERIYEGHLRGMIDTLREAGIAVVLATVPRDLTVPPVLSGIHGAPEPEVVAMIEAVERPDPAAPPDPDGVLARALAVDDRVSFFHYKLGQHRLNQGREAEAAAALRAAVSWDLVPDGTPEINAVTARVGAAAGAPVVELEALSDRWLRDPDGFFLDKVHVNAQGADEIGAALAPPVARALR